MSPPELHYWCRETRKLCKLFLALSFDHIYREHNQLADRLSKAALSLAPGMGSYSEFFYGLLTSHSNFKLFWVGVGLSFPFCTLSSCWEMAPLVCCSHAYHVHGRYGMAWQIFLMGIFYYIFDVHWTPPQHLLCWVLLGMYGDMSCSVSPLWL